MLVLVMRYFYSTFPHKWLKILVFLTELPTVFVHSLENNPFP